MTLPIFQTQNKDITLLQNKWSSEINPMLKNPSLDSIILKSVPLVLGPNQVNHMLGRTLQGWRIVRRRLYTPGGGFVPYDIYDSQDENQQPKLTLFLQCSQGTATEPVVVDIEVF